MNHLGFCKICVFRLLDKYVSRRAKMIASHFGHHLTNYDLLTLARKIVKVSWHFRELHASYLKLVRDKAW